MPVAGGSAAEAPRDISPKRRQREAARDVETTGARTRSQEALRLALEAGKLARRRVSREERRAEAARRHLLRRERQKARYRGK